MKGVYFQRRSKPKYLFTWDVSCVLKFLSSLFPLNKLSLKLLTFQVVALIAVAAAPRASMDLDQMLVKENQVVFYFPYLLKTSPEGHSFSLRLSHYKDEKLCVMHTLL